MAGAEERCGTARGESRWAADHLGTVFIGLAIAATLAAQAPAASAQEAPAGPPAAGAPGGAQAPGAPGGAQTPGAPGAPGEAQEPGAPGGAAAPGAPGEAQAPAGPGGGPANGPAWIITPSITASESFTDNALSTPTKQQADAYTTIEPGIAVSGQSARLQGIFNYEPEAVVYARTSNQDQILQNLFSDGTLTAIPNLLFFDGNASISNSSRFGGLGYNNAAQIPSSEATQTIAYRGSPYVQLHFGDWGDVEVRYSFQQTDFTGNTGPAFDSLTGQSLGAISNLTEQSGTLKYDTGERFARVQFSFLSSYTQTNSADNALDSNDMSDTVNGSYVVTNGLSALFGGGYERLIYSEEAPLDFTGPTWNAGFSYHPRDDRQVTLTYGESQGYDAFNGSMFYALGSHATLSASYSESTTNEQQQILQGLLGATQVTPGLTVNQQTGLPQPLVNPNLALQNSILRVQSFQAGLILNGERNHYTASVDRVDETSLTTGGLSQTTNGGTLTWSRDMSPLTTGTLSASYSASNSNGLGIAGATTNALTLGASLAYAVNDTTTATATYSLSRQTGDIGGAILVDIVTFAVRKTF